MMMRVLCLVLVLGLTANAKEIHFDDCGNKEVKTVDVTPCDSDPCSIKKGSSVSISAKLIANQDSTTASIRGIVTILGVPMDLPDIEPNACKTLRCPLKKGQEYTYKFDVVTQTFFPSMDIPFKFEATGDNGLLACVTTMVNIKD